MELLLIIIQIFLSFPHGVDVGIYIGNIYEPINTIIFSLHVFASYNLGINL